MMKRKNIAVYSKRGFFSSLQILVMFFATNISVLSVVGMLVTGEVKPLLLIGGAVGGICGYWICLKAFTARYEVDAKGMSVQDIWGKQRIQWEQVKEMWINPNYFGSFNINLTFEGQKRRVLLLTSLIGNRKEVAQAVIEAAITENPRVQLKGWGENAYGSPPYGIFTDKRTDSQTKSSHFS